MMSFSVFLGFEFWERGLFGSVLFGVFLVIFVRDLKDKKSALSLFL